MKRLRVLVVAGVLALGTAGAGTAHAAPLPDAAACPAGEVFATNNTAVITDPGDPRLRTHLTGFDREVRGIVRANGARTARSTLLDGVFWSEEQKQTTYERSREFDVNGVGRDGLHHIAGVIAKRYQQESVLTFRCLPRDSAETDAVEIQAEGVSATRLRDALAADPEARQRLGGGSVTLGGRLILIAPLTDLPLAQRFSQRLGVDWDKTRVRYGDEEFVS
ncbi:hypothetical protein BX286_0527 [Streptomyces sp. 3211.6]|uniref:hypothetical protein n=1 Tax=Streptomyces TaxID=1883 RepID=UPI0009A52666|nr:MULTISPECIES: hypothetical protein [Streptomyces]RKT02618.1 hypothetical protein BX286_0527 [Streptomyces sp. 3211.6]RPF43943.1 hypothetical protein EDD96_0460 [Streptomyces sp. Ag109_G2-6]